ncbi:hypothetical protein NCCP2716_05560 [Sporosarcina sp. NCCP-2716]|uniref:hypothetical protein n=1 Tax=Sporosarcina sp. NCCP-2716 TaxID=2943679 RepID=UPI00203CC70E|nr:hypothetical protein [Sporosarcina sp. NCCP-2716]GKV68058.1 hypothetical protein NCCP2716_05560 [Sporosarcina sp. NCCP-2716]
MNPQRKRIIISEIQYWKKNRLLPEHYCDFLITLYAQGESAGAEPAKTDKAVLEKERSAVTNRMILMGLLAAVLFAGLFLIKDHPAAAVSAAAAVAALLIIRLLFSRKVRTALVPFTYIITALLILGISLKVWFAFFEGETMLLLGLLMLNSILWLFAGRLLKLLYFTISGSAGLLLIIGFLLISY